MSPAIPAGFTIASGEPGGLVIVFLLGRALFSAMFIMSGLNHFFRLRATAEAAESAGVPAPVAATLASGFILLAGGLSVLLGVAVRAGTALLVIFLLPTAFIMHRFWGLDDPAASQNQLAHFLKNLVMAGAALMIHYFTAVAPEAWHHAVGP